MINIEKLSVVIASYKKYFPEHWADEKYKWEAVKHFQDKWDINATDFATMLEMATAKTYNLLASGYFYPRGMIVNYAKVDPEATRAMFINLFDESRGLEERVDAFQVAAEQMRATYDDGTWKNDYQNTNAISTYLWLRFPDKYYIYKYSECLSVSKTLQSSFVPKRNATAACMIGGFKLYDEICEQLIRDAELSNMLQEVLTQSCYRDSFLRTMTIDFGYFISHYYVVSINGSSEWFPTDYAPGLSVKDWEKLLSDSEVFTSSSLEIMKRIQDYGGMATCTQLATKYGETKNFYSTGSYTLARRVAEKTGCPVMERDSESTRWWPVLYVGRPALKEDMGSYVWKLRDELKEALERIDLTGVALFAETSPAFWKISHGTEQTGISNSNKLKFAERKVVVVHSTTKAKGIAKVLQGENFMSSIRKDDYFFLCYGSEIQLLGQFTSGDTTLNPEMMDGWYERPYRIIAKPSINTTYTGQKKWWTPNENSTCIKVSDEDKPLFEELILRPYFSMTLSQILGDKIESHGYWWLNANPRIWSFNNIAVGEVQSYTLYNDNGNKRRVFQNFLDAKVGDLVIGYESNPEKQVVAIARITSEQDGQSLNFEKIEGLSTPIEYHTLKGCPELERMEYFTNPQGSLFKLTKGEFDFIMDVIRESNPAPLLREHKVYTKEKCLEKVYMTEERFDSLLSLMKHKKNIVLQGAPGVGKTFIAKRLAYAIMGEKDDSRIEFIQFHQNYSYEDFIMGYKPQDKGFRLTNGIFYRFCITAANHLDQDYFFIIDEINRGNMSKIFGELLMLIERDYRDTKATLAYSGMPFSVPRNLYIIGIMNTADRSLAMIDYALRRRFSFFEMEPGFQTKGFKAYQESFHNETFNALIERIEQLNKEIVADSSLGEGFRIGHSYFCEQETCTEDWMKEVVFCDIIPMLKEYWFDDKQKLQRWENTLSGVFND